MTDEAAPAGNPPPSPPPTGANPQTGQPPAQAAAPAPETTPPQGSAPATEAGTPPQGEQPPDNRTPAEKRIQELVATNKRLQEIADTSQEYARFWQQRAAQGARVPDDVATAQAAAAQPKPAPTLKDFKGNTEKWAEALHEWNTAEIQRGIELGISRATTEATAAQQRNAARQTYQQRVDEFRQTNPDFDAVIRTPGLHVTDKMRDAIVASDVGPAIAHHLGKNVALSQEIASLPPEMQMFRIGEIAATVRATRVAAQNNAPPPGNPPPPPNPLDGQQPAAFNMATASLDEFLIHRLGVRPPPP